MGEMSDARSKWYDDTWFVPGGVDCPCCDRRGKVYKTRFTGSFARTLVWLFAKTESGNWCHVPKKGDRGIVTSNNVGKLSKWGLSDRKPNLDDPTKNCLGVHRISQRGKEFIAGLVSIPEYIYIYNDKRVELHWDSEDVVKDITIDQTKGGFDFEEIMRGIK